MRIKTRVRVARDGPTRAGCLNTVVDSPTKLSYPQKNGKRFFLVGSPCSRENSVEIEAGECVANVAVLSRFQIRRL